MNINELLRNVSRDVAELNQHLLTPTKRRIDNTTPRRPDTELESKFLTHWNLLTRNEPMLRDYIFAPHERKYEIDFYHEGSRVGVETNGATWTTGGHSTGQGISRDYQKALLAATHGIIILFVSSDMLRETQIAYTIDQIWRVIQYRSRQS